MDVSQVVIPEPSDLDSLHDITAKAVFHHVMRGNEDAMRNYFDHAATSPLRPSAADAWLAAAEIVGNPSALHASGRRARAGLEDAREELATLLGARPDEVIFTAGGSESDSLAVLGAACAKPTQRVVISTIEHPAVATISQLLPERVSYLPVDAAGHVQIDEDLQFEDVGLISVQAVNNEIGTVQDLDQVVELAKRTGAWVHCDGVQALGHVDFNFAVSGLDLASFSAHKLGGPVGIGLLLKRRGVDLPQVSLGGGQEAGLRSGTQMLGLAAGFAAAAREAIEQRAELAARLADFEAQILACLADVEGVLVNGGARRSAHILNLQIAGASGEDVLFLLDSAGIDVSTGSACRAGVHGPSEILLALGQDAEAASSAVRISMGWTTNQDDIDALIAVLPKTIATARSVPR